MKFESRYLKAAGLEVRESDAGSPVITGTGIVYNRLSQDLGGWFERIDPKAANKTLGDGAVNVYASFNHDSNFILGRVGAGTLRMANTPTGLVYEIDPPLTSPMGQHVVEACRRGDVSGSSFTFRTVTAPSWSVDDAGRTVRTVTELALYELGPVVSPAYLDTDASARQVVRELAESRSIDPREVEACLREGNLRDIVSASVSVRLGDPADGGPAGMDPAADAPAEMDPAEDGAACSKCGTAADDGGRCASCGAFTKAAQPADASGTVEDEGTTPRMHVTPRLTIARYRLEALTRGE